METEDTEATRLLLEESARAEIDRLGQHEREPAVEKVSMENPAIYGVQRQHDETNFRLSHEGRTGSSPRDQEGRQLVREGVVTGS